MAAAARSFFSKVIDAVGAEPEEKYLGRVEHQARGMSDGNTEEER